MGFNFFMLFFHEEPLLPKEQCSTAQAFFVICYILSKIIGVTDTKKAGCAISIWDRVR